MTIGNHKIYVGDTINVMRTPPADWFHCVVTSPPYWGLRDYGVEGQIGQEPTPEAFVETMVQVFRAVRRVLREDGTLWLNIGDTYAAARGGTPMPAETLAGGVSGRGDTVAKRGRESGYTPHRDPASHGLKHKDLIGIPWRVAIALQADGWWLRSDIIWHKPAPMPESVTDRPTRAHEYLFLLTKNDRYFYDAEAIKEESVSAGEDRGGGKKYSDRTKDNGIGGAHNLATFGATGPTRNRRTVWTVASEPFAGAHFATYPTKLVEPCIKAGTSERGCCPECGAPWKRIVDRERVMRERPNALTKRDGSDGQGNVCPNDVAGVSTRTTGWQPGCEHRFAPVACRVLDPFSGSGTTAGVACTLGRDGHGIELNPEYARMSEERIAAMTRPSTARVDREEESPLFAKESL